MGLTTRGMHYTGMAASRFSPKSFCTGTSNINTGSLALTTGVIAFVALDHHPVPGSGRTPQHRCEPLKSLSVRTPPFEAGARARPDAAPPETRLRSCLHS
jgi:hypothetical protein